MARFAVEKLADLAKHCGIDGVGDVIVALTCSADGQYIYVASRRGRVYVIDAFSRSSDDPHG